MPVPLWIKRIVARIEAATNGYLPQVGWIDTRAQFRAMDARGKAIPWFTYPAIKFLEDRARPEWRVLEFGAGMGTIWWSRASAGVFSLEHDPHWQAYVSSTCSAQVVLAARDSAASYMKPALDSGPYDVVIVDGLFREECLSAAPDYLSDTGIVVLDDAHRNEYKSGIDRLLGRGFLILEFHGPQPVSKHPGCTAILYREENVLGI